MKAHGCIAVFMLAWSLLSGPLCPAAEPATGPATRPGPRIIGTLKIETPDEWVAQTNLWGIITVRNPGPEARPLGHNVDATIARFGAATGSVYNDDLELLDPDTGAVRYRHESRLWRQPLGVSPTPAGAGGRPPNLGMPVAREPKWLPENGEISSFAQIFWSEGMPQEGTFRLRLVAYVVVRDTHPYAGTAYTGTSAAIRIRPPTEAEVPYLIPPSLREQYYRTARDAPAPPADPPASLLAALGPEWLLRDLMIRPIKVDLPPPENPTPPQEMEWYVQYRTKQLAQLDVGAIGRGLPPFYDPLVNLLRCEILHYQGRLDEAAALRQRTLKDYPGLAWQFDIVDRGSGLIAGLRVDYWNIFTLMDEARAAAATRPAATQPAEGQSP
jgi:hypothetical protein